jgi:cytochrome c551/c552
MKNVKRTIGAVLILCFSSSFAQDGKSLFQQNCMACHMMGRDLVGPDLTDIHKKRKEDWLIKFIRSSQSMIASGDKQSVDVFEKWNRIPMPDQNLTDAEIKSILSYIKTYSKGADAKPVEKPIENPAEEKASIEVTEEKVTISETTLSIEPESNIQEAVVDITSNFVTTKNKIPEKTSLQTTFSWVIGIVVFTVLALLVYLLVFIQKIFH